MAKQTKQSTLNYGDVLTTQHKALQDRLQQNIAHRNGLRRELEILERDAVAIQGGIKAITDVMVELGVGNAGENS